MKHRMSPAGHPGHRYDGAGFATQTFMRLSRAIMSTNVMARSPVGRDDLLTGKVYALVEEIATAVAS